MFPFFGNIIGNSATAPEMAQSVPFRRLRVNATIFLFLMQKIILDFKYSVTKRAQCSCSLVIIGVN